MAQDMDARNLMKYQNTWNTFRNIECNNVLQWIDVLQRKINPNILTSALDFFQSVVYIEKLLSYNIIYTNIQKFECKRLKYLLHGKLYLLTVQAGEHQQCLSKQTTESDEKKG